MCKLSYFGFIIYESGAHQDNPVPFVCGKDIIRKLIVRALHLCIRILLIIFFCIMLLCVLCLNLPSLS